MNFDLKDETFLFFAVKHYDNPACGGMKEFEDDLKRFSYIKRLLNKSIEDNGLRVRLTVNHIVILCNLFGAEQAAGMLFLKIDQGFWPQLKTFLVYLNCMPEELRTINGAVLRSSDISMDENLISTLRQL